SVGRCHDRADQQRGRQIQTEQDPGPHSRQPGGDEDPERRQRQARDRGQALSTLGVLVTAGLTGVGTWLLLGLDLPTALLVGAVVASTDAAAVFSMMRTTPLPRRVSAVLRIESGANDPIAVLLRPGVATAWCASSRTPRQRRSMPRPRRPAARWADPDRAGPRSPPPSPRP
ncbi:MAG: cation:proton antiporter, partial [Nitriliruptoraceae bacterium]